MRRAPFPLTRIALVIGVVCAILARSRSHG